MKLFEYQAKEAFREKGLPTPKGVLVRGMDELDGAFAEVGFPCVLKSQVLSGGRGKAGLIKVVKDAESAKATAKTLFESEHNVRMLLVEEAVDIDREIYLSITVDPVESKIMLIGCAEGGVEIEKLAATDPDKIVTVRVDIAEGLGGYHVNNLTYGMGLSGDLGKQVGAVVRGLYKTFRAYDAQLAEINPLFINKDGKAIAGDGKERKKLEALTKELGLADSVFFLGWVNDLDSFYGALDINTLSSLSEAFPYALPEGARAHLATVASNVGGVPAIIEHGVTGLLIEPGDVRMLAAYLARYALDEDYRHEMGEALYRRGKADFSEEATGLRQLEIYNAVFRMERNRRDGVRDGVLICGAYGFGNAGDDAILQAIIGEMRRIDAHMPVTVISRRPKDTRSAYGVNACNRFHYLAIRRVLRRSQLFISGGGSLMQDVTSRMSLWYYLSTIRLAHRCGCKVQMYGCGIGPIVYERDRQLAARIINDCVDKITLREPDSRETLSDFGVTEPEVILASDPALTLPAAERGRIDRILREHDMDPDGKYIGFVLRKWPGIEEKATVFAAGAVYAYLKYGLTPVFLSINFRTDGEASQLVTEHLSIPFHVLGEQMSTGEVIGVLSRMTAVVSMRLHGLIFAAGQGVPLIGVAYDPKVTAFLDYVEQTNYMQFEAVNEEDLSDQIDAAVALAGRGEELRRRTELLNRQEDNNRATAARLLGKE